MSAEISLQKALYEALSSDPAVISFVLDRIFDRVPANAPRPYVHLRDFNSNAVSSGCIDAFEIFAGIDVWSDGVGKAEASGAAFAIVDRLHEADLDLGPDFVLVDLRHRSTVIADDGDGLTTRARMTFVALVDRT